MRLPIIAVAALLLILASSATALANPPANPPDQGKISVVVFLDKLYREDAKCMEILTKGLHERFGAANVAIFGGSSPKSPAFMEFVEGIQIYPANERGILVVPDKYFYKYGEDTKASHVLFVVVSSGKLEQGGLDGRKKSRIKTDITVFSVNAKKVLLNKIINTGESLLPFREAAQRAADQLQSDFRWMPSDAETRTAPVNSISVVTFLPREVIDKPELFSTVTKSIAEKIRNADIINYGDYQSKSPEYMEFIVKVSDDSAMQKALVVKKGHLIKYGKDAGYRTVVVFRMYISEKEAGFSTGYRVKDDISVLAVDSGKYVGNYVFDTEKKVSLSEAVEILMNKLKAEFKMPAEAATTDNQ
jgi:hypothetical protein